MAECVEVSMAHSRFTMGGCSRLHPLNQRHEVLAVKRFYLPWLVANWLPPAGEPRQGLRGEVSAHHVSHKLLTPLFFSSSGVAPTLPTRPVEKLGCGPKGGPRCSVRTARNSADLLSIVGSSVPPHITIGTAASSPPKLSTHPCDRVCSPKLISSAPTVEEIQKPYDAEQVDGELLLGSNEQQMLGTERVPKREQEGWDQAPKKCGTEGENAPTSVAACAAGRGNGQDMEVTDAGTYLTDRNDDWSRFLPEQSPSSASPVAVKSAVPVPLHVLRYCHDLVCSPVPPAPADAVDAVKVSWGAQEVHKVPSPPRSGQQLSDGGQQAVSNLENGSWWEAAGSTGATVSTTTPRSVACDPGDGNEQASEVRDAGTSSAGFTDEWSLFLPNQDLSPPPRLSAESAAPIPLHVLRYCRDLVTSPGSPVSAGVTEDKTTCWEDDQIRREVSVPWNTQRRREGEKLASDEDEGEIWEEPAASASATVSTAASRAAVSGSDAADKRALEATGTGECSAEYDDEHHAFLRGQEVKFFLQPSYLTGPNRPGVVNPAQRTALVDWLAKLHQLAPKACEGSPPLCHESLFLAVNIMDRFLSTAEGVLMASRGESALKFVAAAALSLASKYEEIEPPSLWAITVASKLALEARRGGAHCPDCSCAVKNGSGFEGVGGTGSSCTCGIRETRKELAAVETCLASALEFRMAAPTALSFLGIFVRRAQDLGYLDTSVVEEVRAEATETLLSALRDPYWLDHVPSAQAAAAIFWALCVCPHVCIVDGAVASFALLAVAGYERDKLQRCLSNIIYTRTAQHAKGQDWVFGGYGLAGSDGVGEGSRFDTLENGFSGEVGSFRATVSPLIDVSPDASSDSLFSFSFFEASVGHRTIAAL